MAADARAALAELRARHSPESKPDACLAVHGGPHPICDYCVSTWPCDAARLLDVAEEATPLLDLPEWTGGDTVEIAATTYNRIRAALARLGEGE